MLYNTVEGSGTARYHMLYSTVEGSGAARHQRLASRVRFGFKAMTFWRDSISRHVAQEQVFRKTYRKLRITQNQKLVLLITSSASI
jgi:hypothetical protein